MAFDVLTTDGEPTLRLPYAERHALLEEVTIDGPPSVVEVIGSFNDGPALWEAIVERGLEGVVAKRERESYRPGARLWVTTKNRATARFQEELGGVRRFRSAEHQPELISLRVKRRSGARTLARNPSALVGGAAGAERLHRLVDQAEDVSVRILEPDAL
jgi:ATP-dependent DNA ligase